MMVVSTIVSGGSISEPPPTLGIWASNNKSHIYDGWFIISHPIG
jgi:hypothetical protein